MYICVAIFLASRLDLVSPGRTWTFIGSLGFTLTHLGLTWIHVRLDSFNRSCAPFPSSLASPLPQEAFPSAIWNYSETKVNPSESKWVQVHPSNSQ